MEPRVAMEALDLTTFCQKVAFIIINDTGTAHVTAAAVPMVVFFAAPEPR